MAKIYIERLPEEKRPRYKEMLEDAKYRGSKKKLEEIIKKVREEHILLLELKKEDIFRLLENIPESERKYYQIELNKAIIEGYILQIKNGDVYLADYALKVLEAIPYPEREKYEKELESAVFIGEIRQKMLSKMRELNNIVGSTIELYDYFLKKGEKNEDILLMLETDNVKEAIKSASYLK